MSDTGSIVNALMGGALIGLAASGMLLSIGRVTGVSGIMGGILFPKKHETSWRLMFLLGLVMGGLLMVWIGGFQFDPILNRSLLAVGIGGILVGLGTQIGNGCTSGHGVCGVSRLSPRSLVATGAFMISAMVTVYVVEHLLGGF